MASEKKTLYEEAVDLLRRINEDLKEHKLISTINTKMVGVVKDLNEVSIGEITGKEVTEESSKA